MIEISDIDATIIYEDLNKFKSLVIKDSNFLESAEDFIDLLKSETHANVINGCNFRRNYKVLRTMTRSAISIRDTKGLDSSKLIDYFLKVLSPMSKALESNVIYNPTEEQANQITLTRAKNKLLLMDSAVNLEEEDEEENVDENAINKLLKNSVDTQRLIDLEQNLRTSILNKLDKSRKKQKVKLDVNSLLPKSHVENEGNKPFSQLGELLKEKLTNTSSKEDLLEFVKINGPESVAQLTDKQRKKLYKLLPKEDRDLMVKTDDYLVEQLNILKDYTIDKYDIPVLEEDEQFKLFTAPVFTVTSPYLQQSSLEHIKDLSAKLIFPGWLLDSQVIATIHTSMYKSKEYPKLVKTILSMLKTRTHQSWIHVSEDMEFKLKGYPTQTFLWFIPYEYTKYLGNFSVEELSFPFYLTTKNTADIQKLKEARLNRERSVDELLMPLYNKMSDMYSTAERYTEQVERAENLQRTCEHELEQLKLNKTVNMSELIKVKQKAKKLESIIFKLGKKIKTYTDKSNELIKTGNRWYKKLNSLSKQLKSCSTDLSTVDLSFFEEE